MSSDKAKKIRRAHKAFAEKTLENVEKILREEDLIQPRQGNGFEV